MFCSSSIGVHITRGLLALALIVAAIATFTTHPYLAIPAAIGAVFLLRGCPMCWLIGLFETVANRRAQRRNA